MIVYIEHLKKIYSQFLELIKFRSLVETNHGNNQCNFFWTQPQDIKNRIFISVPFIIAINATKHMQINLVNATKNWKIMLLLDLSEDCKKDINSTLI